MNGFHLVKPDGREPSLDTGLVQHAARDAQFAFDNARALIGVAAAKEGQNMGYGIAAAHGADYGTLSPKMSTTVPVPRLPLKACHDGGMLEALKSLRAESIGDRIKLVRKLAGVTQEVFADKAGISRDMLKNYELGTKRPSIDAAVKISETYGLTLDFIYLGRIQTLTAEMRDKIIALAR